MKDEGADVVMNDERTMPHHVIVPLYHLASCAWHSSFLVCRPSVGARPLPIGSVISRPRRAASQRMISRAAAAPAASISTSCGLGVRPGTNNWWTSSLIA
jgi:hypothetical protein